jgi:ABC-2 type transport system permease protein
MLNETYKRLLVVWAYKFNVLMQVILVGIIFIGASFLLGNGQFHPGQLTTIFIGYIVWLYARVLIPGISSDLTDEAQAGTLEQMYMSPAPAEVLLLGRIFAMLITSTILVLLTALGLVLLLHITLPLRWESIPVLILTLVGLCGFTLILGGATLVFKQTESMADLIQNMLMFLTGSLLPIDRFPQWLSIIARTLPITQGIDVLRRILQNGESLRSVWDDWSLIWLIIHSSIYLCVGWVVFKWCEKIAKKQGTLSQY